MENALNLDTVVLAENEEDMIILDQTLLPNETKYLTLNKAEDIWEAIYKLRVRGAPAIGVAGAYGYYVLARQFDTEDMDEFVKKCTEMMEYLNSSRPTAVNLSWALNRMHEVLLSEKEGKTVAQMKERLKEEANAVREEDIQISRNIGAYGYELLKDMGDEVGIMTHCKRWNPGYRQVRHCPGAGVHRPGERLGSEEDPCVLRRDKAAAAGGQAVRL